MSEKEITGLREAAKVAGVSYEAVRHWCGNLEIGELRNGVWVINRAALMRVVKARKILGRS